MVGQYLLANNDSPGTITVKFEHRSAIRIRFENTQDTGIPEKSD